MLELYDDPHLIGCNDNKARTNKVELVHKAVEANICNSSPVKDMLIAYVSGASMRC